MQIIKLPGATVYKCTVDESVEVGFRKINIILNWFEEVKDRVPTD